MIKILFVCLGNICRSPMAEGILNHLVSKRRLQDQISCDSAGTSDYHLGELPDTRMRNTARQHQIELVHRARQLSEQDFSNFDYIIAMDRFNLDDILALKRKAETRNGEVYSCRVVLMRDYDTPGGVKDVPDPYYGGKQGFEDVYQILWRCNEALIDSLVNNGG